MNQLLIYLMPPYKVHKTLLQTLIQYIIDIKLDWTKNKFIKMCLMIVKIMTLVNSPLVLGQIYSMNYKIIMRRISLIQQNKNIQKLDKKQKEWLMILRAINLQDL